VCLSDQDDEWFADKIIKSINLLKQTNTFGYSSNYYLKKKSNLHFYDKISKQKLYDYFFESPGPGCTFTLSKKLFLSFQKKVRKDFPMNITYHDWLIYSFARSNNFNWIIDDNPSINYRQHNNNVIGENISFKARIKRLKLLYNGWWFNQINNIVLWLDNDKSGRFYNKYLYKRYHCLRLLFIIKHCRRKNFHAFIGVCSIIFLRIILFR
jgi:rhamnosyltransferase